MSECTAGAAAPADVCGVPGAVWHQHKARCSPCLAATGPCRAPLAGGMHSTLQLGASGCSRSGAGLAAPPLAAWAGAPQGECQVAHQPWRFLPAMLPLLASIGLLALVNAHLDRAGLLHGRSVAVKVSHSSQQCLRHCHDAPLSGNDPGDTKTGQSVCNFRLCISISCQDKVGWRCDPQN